MSLKIEKLKYHTNIMRNYWESLSGPDRDKISKILQYFTMKGYRFPKHEYSYGSLCFIVENLNTQFTIDKDSLRILTQHPDYKHVIFSKNKKRKLSEI